MDCLEGMKQLKSGCIDLTVTSPPYDNLRNYNGFKWDFKSIAKELYRVTKNGGVVVWVVGDKVIDGSESGTSFKQALYFMSVGFNLHDTMIYEKDSINFPEKNRYSQIFEYMFILSKGKPNTANIIKDRKNKWYDGKKHIKGNYKNADGEINRHHKENLLKEYGSRYNIWRISTGCGKSSTDKIAFKHPAIFPEKLANDHIISWSNKNDIVMDIFMGSGTTAKMALKNKRNYIGFEVSTEYCQIAEKRLNEPMQIQVNYGN